MDRTTRTQRIRGRGPAVALTAAVAGACGLDASGPLGFASTEGLECSIPVAQIFSGQVRDGIPALSDPAAVRADAPAAEYLRDDDRVAGVIVGDTWLAVPLNILWHHEIVNLDVEGVRIAVTHCPLTGSTLAFDRSPLGGVDFGVSGLLYRNNLLMYDRSDEESLWPQLLRGARCGPETGRELDMFPVVEMTWAGWRSLYPDTRVVGSDTGAPRDYTFYPYGDYDRIDNPETLFPMPSIDRRRPPKERVLGLPDGAGGGVAFPFLELAELGATGVVAHGGRWVFWDSWRRAAMAFQGSLDGEPIAFEVRDREIVDVGTGSVWAVDGIALSGPLAGRRLTAVPEAYVVYWFAWASFQPDAELWTAPAPRAF